MGRVIVLGSLNIDLVTHVERHPRPGETVLGEGLRRLAGGKGANQAVAAAAAGAGAAMLGCVGDDEGGAAYLLRLRERGVDVSGVRTVPGGTTGHALIAVDDAGENSIIVIPGANALVPPDPGLVAGIEAGDVLLVQLEVPVRTVAVVARAAHGAGARVVLNIAPYAAVPQDVVAFADPVIANEHEAALLADSDAVAGSLLVTFGAAGAAWGGMNEPGLSVPAEEVVDTTGAGDAFCGALAAALADGAGREAAMSAALAAGARAVRHTGAQPDAEL
jgi:ribokinase